MAKLPPLASRTPRGAWTRLAWPLTLVVVVLVGAGLYAFWSLRRLPGEVASQGRQVLEDVRRVAQAFHQGTITTSFVSFATEVRGTSFLQFATLKEVEVFQRTDRATTLWGQLELPEVVVQATAPVEYTYYLDLDGRWTFELQGETLWVHTPEIRFNTPAVDASALRYEVRSGSVFRDEEEALTKLQEGITALARRRARENIELVRELGRRKTEEFVTHWLVQAFSDGASYRVEVAFADEGPRPPTTESRLKDEP